MIPSSQAISYHPTHAGPSFMVFKGVERKHGSSFSRCSFAANRSKADKAKKELRQCVEIVLRPNVIALALPDRPLIPGFYMPIWVKDPQILKSLEECRKSLSPYVGAFLLKDEPRADVKLGYELETNGILDMLKGKDLLNRLHEVGTLAEITRIEEDQVFLLGYKRLKITELVSEDPLIVKVDFLEVNFGDKSYDYDYDNIATLSSEVILTLSDVIDTSSLWRDHSDLVPEIEGCGYIGDTSWLADCGPILTGADKFNCQEVLEELDVYKRLNLTLELSRKALEECNIQELSKKAIEDQKSGCSDENEYNISEKPESDYDIAEKFRKRIDKVKCPPHVLQVIEKELAKLKHSLWCDVTRNYLDCLTALPWGIYSAETFDVIVAQNILDECHYGLRDIKERILEFIAVGKLRGTTKGKIICLAGPPGTGKTSIARSIARALNRKFYRFSVGGLFDVHEIKGFNRTYFGAAPGKMVKCLRSVGTANPLVLIDEIDKLRRGNKGDPAGAMLELLDPGQNASFVDQYLDVPIDLSKVLFVCTANVVENITGPLLDRMEIIRIDGYITDEKMHIARDFLEKRAREICGVKAEQVEVTDAALLALVEHYCREPGVRNLQNQIEKIYRKIALQLVRKLNYHSDVASGSFVVTKTDVLADKLDNDSVQSDVEDERNQNLPDDFKNNLETMEKQEKGSSEAVEKITVDAANLYHFVGKPVFDVERIYDHTPVGVAMGLAWTKMGGSTLYIETTLIEEGSGKGGLSLTGQLGDVMKDSAQIAHIVARAIILDKDVDNTFFANAKLHLHVPEGATPKDGPSAGCTMITSLLSLAMNKPVKKDLAVTGEVSLTGKILPIGGVREKVIAARRSHVKTIILPSDNQMHFDELAQNLKEGLDVHFVQDYSQIFEIAFTEENNVRRTKLPLMRYQPMSGIRNFCEKLFFKRECSS